MRSFEVLGFHPAPGDLVAVESIIDGLRAVVADLAEVDTVVRTDSSGQGTVVEALNESLREDFGPRLEQVMHELDAAARALQIWHDSLADYQLRAAALEDEAATAQLDTEDPSAVETVRERARILQEEVDGEAGEIARMLAVSPVSLPADPAALLAHDDNLAAELGSFMSDVAPDLASLPHDVAALVNVSEAFGPPDLPEVAGDVGADWSAGDAAGAWAEAMAAERANPFDLGHSGAGLGAQDGEGSPAVAGFDPHVPGLGELGWSSAQV